LGLCRQAHLASNSLDNAGLDGSTPHQKFLDLDFNLHCFQWETRSILPPMPLHKLFDAGFDGDLWLIVE